MTQNRISILSLAAGIVAALGLLVVEGPVSVSSFTNAADRRSAPIHAVSHEVARTPALASVHHRPAGERAASLRDNPAALNELGVSLVQKKKLWEAAACFEKTIRLDPTGIVPVVNMAVVLSELGLSIPADRYVARARAINPIDPWLLKNFPDGGRQAGPRTAAYPAIEVK